MVTDRPGEPGDPSPGGLLQQLESHLPDKLFIDLDTLLRKVSTTPLAGVCRPKR
jgi:hypothetical protein